MFFTLLFSLFLTFYVPFSASHPSPFIFTFLVCFSLFYFRFFCSFVFTLLVCFLLFFYMFFTLLFSLFWYVFSSLFLTKHANHNDASHITHLKDGFFSSFYLFTLLCLLFTPLSLLFWLFFFCSFKNIDNVNKIKVNKKESC